MYIKIHYSFDDLAHSMHQNQMHTLYLTGGESSRPTAHDC